MEEKDYVLTIEDGKKKEKNTIREKTDKEVYSELEKAAIEAFSPDNRIYSTILKDDESVSLVTHDMIANLCVSPQSDLRKTLTIMSICRQYANFDDIIGLTNESIENNLSTKVRLSFKRTGDAELNRDEVEKARLLIEDFNERIDLPALIARAVPSTWRDGTYVMCLRHSSNNGADYVVDYYPLGVAEISPYEVGGQPYVLVNIQELRKRLQKNYPKNKNRKGLFFDNMDEEVKATYPKEVYEAYIQKEKYAKIPIEFSGVLRVNNQNKQYGLPPAFRALPSAIMLEDFAKADKSTAKARAKKIIAQYLHKEILGENYSRDSFAPQAYAHKTLMDAWQRSTVVVTAPAQVQKIEYVEPKTQMTNIDQILFYRQKEMNTLGISFLANGGSQSLSVANISLSQLMKTIDKISKQLETILKKWYRYALREAGLDPMLAPDVTILDAELMEIGVKKDLADFLFTKMNCSYRTAFELFGINVDDEKLRRENENDAGIEEVFTPRQTAYTSTGDDSGGRPAGDSPATENKRAYDQTRNEVT